MNAKTAGLITIGLLCWGIALAHAQASPGYHVIQRIAVGGDGGWDYLTIDRASQRLYISRSNRVIVADATSGKVVGAITDTPGVHGIAVVPSLHRGYTTNGGDNTSTVFDTQTLKATGRIKVGARPDAILYDRAGGRVFTFNGGSSDATAIDIASDRVVGSVALGGRPEAAVSDGHGTVFVNIEDTSEVVAFDAKSLKVKRRFSVAPGEGPSGLAIDVRGHRLFSVCSNGMMVALDSETGKVLATPAIGQGADGCGYDDRERLAFSSNGADGTLTVIRAGAPGRYAVAETVPTQKSARTMAMDPGAHRIYLSTARFIPSPPGDPGAGRRRLAIEPGSFEILVVGK